MIKRYDLYYYGLAFLVGCSLVQCLPPEGFGPVLIWFILIPLLSRSVYQNPHGYRFWLVVFTTFHGIGFRFIVFLISNFTAIPSLSWLLLLLFALYQSLWFTILFIFCQRVTHSYFYFLVLMTMGYPLVEFFAPMLFPWFLGNSLYEYPILLQSLSLWGLPGISTLLVGGQAGACWYWSQKRKKRALLMLMLPAFILVTTGVFFWKQDLNSHQHVKLSSVQANYGVLEGDPLEVLYDYQNFAKQAEEQEAEIVIYPETAMRTGPEWYTVASSDEVQNSDLFFSYFPYDLTRWFSQEGYGSLQKDAEISVLFGCTSQASDSGQEKKYNTVFGLDKKGFVQGKTTKNKRLLFGEYIPGSEWFPNLRKLLPFSMNLSAFQEPKTIPLEGSNIGILVCYEDLLPGYARRLALSNPDFLVSLSNEAWFGTYPEPYQHQALAQARAIESQKPLVRSTTTGVTSFISARGEVLQKLESAQRGLLTGTISFARNPKGTVYVRWGYYLPYCLILLFGLCLTPKIKSKLEN